MKTNEIEKMVRFINEEEGRDITPRHHSIQDIKTRYLKAIDAILANEFRADPTPEQLYLYNKCAQENAPTDKKTISERKAYFSKMTKTGRSDHTVKPDRER